MRNLYDTWQAYKQKHGLSGALASIRNYILIVLLLRHGVITYQLLWCRFYHMPVEEHVGYVATIIKAGPGEYILYVGVWFLVHIISYYLFMVRLDEYKNN